MRGKLVKDDEAKAMAKIVELIEALDATARARVVTYIAARYAAPKEDR